MKHLNNEKGQALVEFALVLPILLLFFLGIVEFGRIFHAQMVIDQAARDAVRYGSVSRSDSEILQVIQDETMSLEQSRINVSIQPNDATRRSGDVLTIRIQYEVPLMLTFLSNWIPNPFPLSASMKMRVE